MKAIARIALAAVPSRFMHHFGFAVPTFDKTAYITPSSQAATHIKEFESPTERLIWINTATKNGFTVVIEGVHVFFAPASILYVEQLDQE